MNYSSMTDAELRDNQRARLFGNRIVTFREYAIYRRYIDGDKVTESRPVNAGHAIVASSRDLFLRVMS